MSQRVNVSSCPFHRSVRMYGPHTCPHYCAADRQRPPCASSCFSCSVAPHLHLFMEKVKLATWPAIWRGPDGYPKQAKHNPITPQGDAPHLPNSAWVIFVSLWELVKIYLHVYSQPRTRVNKCSTRFKLLLCSTVTFLYLQTILSSCGGTNKNIDAMWSFVCKK